MRHRTRIQCCAVCASLLVMAAASVGTAEVYTVLPDGNGDFPTIQAAIDAAEEWDVIELGDGTFTGDGNRSVSFLGKAVTVRSASGDPEACVVDCEMVDCGFVFASGEGPLSVLDGLTITQGYSWYPNGGGGVYCNGSSPTLRNLVLSGNHVQSSNGGGMMCHGGSPTLTDVTFLGNEAYTEFMHYNSGGGLYSIGSNVTLTNVMFSENYALINVSFVSNGGGTWEHSRTGGLDIVRGAIATLLHVEFRDNYDEAMFVAGSASLTAVTFSDNYEGALSCFASAYVSTHVILENVTFSHNREHGIECAGATLELENTIIAFTSDSYPVEGHAITGEGDITLTCCNIFGNEGGDWVGPIADQYGVNGNMAMDPVFCSDEHPEYPYTLHSNSPCAPNSPSNPDCGLIGAWPIGCGPTIVEEMTWGSIKAMYLN